MIIITYHNHHSILNEAPLDPITEQSNYNTDNDATAQQPQSLKSDTSINGQLPTTKHYNTIINRTNPGQCIISQVWPMAGPAGCRLPCTDSAKYKSGMTFRGPWNSTDGSNQFLNNYQKATNYIKNNPKYKYYSLDALRSVGTHMAMQYTCCLSLEQTFIIDKVRQSFTFEPIEIKFDKVICVLDGRYNKGWTDEASHVSLVIMPDQISQQRLYQITDKFEKEAMEYVGDDGWNFGCWKQGRRASQPFHVTIGVFYGNNSYVEEAVDELNRLIPVWNEKPILIDESKIERCNTEEKGHRMDGTDHYYDCWLPKPARKNEMIENNIEKSW